MAIIHRTTLIPAKLELLASWLPAQPWYLGSEHAPELTKVGGFRLDDPEGEVGIEFMVVTHDSGERAHHLPGAAYLPCERMRWCRRWPDRNGRARCAWTSLDLRRSP